MNRFYLKWFLIFRKLFSDLILLNQQVLLRKDHLKTAFETITWHNCMNMSLMLPVSFIDFLIVGVKM